MATWFTVNETDPAVAPASAATVTSVLELVAFTGDKALALARSAALVTRLANLLFSDCSALTADCCVERRDFSRV